MKNAECSANDYHFELAAREESAVDVKMQIPRLGLTAPARFERHSG
jgi:hypothetical protein